MDPMQTKQVLEAIELPFKLGLHTYIGPYGQMYFRIHDPMPVCNVTGKPLPICQGRRWELSVHMLPGEVVGTVWLAVQTYVMHEMREQFKYKGAMIYGPHMNVDRLVELALSPDGIVEREH